MINARKSISLSWKERNGQRSANPWQRRRRKERSWQNTVRERRSLFSRRRKEPESPDKKNYGVSIKEAADALAQALNAGAISVQDIGTLVALAAVGYDESIQEPSPVPNNWLKMHGLPMRRKGRGKKHESGFKTQRFWLSRYSGGKGNYEKERGFKR